MNESRGWMPGRKLFFAVVGIAIVSIVAITALFAMAYNANIQLAAENARFHNELTSARTDLTVANDELATCVTYAQFLAKKFGELDDAYTALVDAQARFDALSYGAAAQSIVSVRSSVTDTASDPCLVGR